MKRKEYFEEWESKGVYFSDSTLCDWFALYGTPTQKKAFNERDEIPDDLDPQEVLKAGRELVAN